jgi:hypothetical protein
MAAALLSVSVPAHRKLVGLLVFGRTEVVVVVVGVVEGGIAEGGHRPVQERYSPVERSRYTSRVRERQASEAYCSCCGGVGGVVVVADQEMLLLAEVGRDIQR